MDRAESAGFLKSISRLWKSKGTYILKKYGLTISFVLISAVISFITPNFLSSRNIMNILRQSSIIGVMAIGTAFVIIGGGFDISVGSVLALTAAMALGLQKWMHWGFAVVTVLCVGAVIGFLNGFLSAKIHIVPIITTLGTMTIVRGLTYLYTGGYPILGTSESFKPLVQAMSGLYRFRLYSCL